jgi:1,4-dihydroxy-2-naphthoate octaprenyltransferase
MHTLKKWIIVTRLETIILALASIELGSPLAAFIGTFYWCIVYCLHKGFFSNNLRLLQNNCQLTRVLFRGCLSISRLSFRRIGRI